MCGENKKFSGGEGRIFFCIFSDIKKIIMCLLSFPETNKYDSCKVI